MKSLIAVGFALAAGWTAPAQAALVTFDFSSVEKGFVGDVPIPNGAAFNGSLTIDTSVLSSPGFIGLNYAGAFKSIDLSGEIIDVSHWAVNNINVGALTGIGVFNQHGRTFDFFAQNGNAKIELFLATSDGSLDPTEQLPTALPALSVFDQANSLDFGDASGHAFDRLTALGAAGAVPEPSGLALFAASLSLLGLFAIGIKSKSSALAA